MLPKLILEPTNSNVHYMFLLCLITIRTNGNVFLCVQQVLTAIQEQRGKTVRPVFCHLVVAVDCYCCLSCPSLLQYCKSFYNKSVGIVAFVCCLWRLIAIGFILFYCLLLCYWNIVVELIMIERCVNSGSSAHNAR